MVRLFYPSKYAKYPWFNDVHVARERYQYLSGRFKDVGQEDKLKINKELEVIDDYFDWLQILL